MNNVFSLMAFLLFISVTIIACNQGRGDEAERISHSDTINEIARIEWSDTIIDLGNHIRGVNVPFSFVLKNVGNKPLVISKIEGTCGCTVINTDSIKSILPGNADSIYGNISTHELEDEAIRKLYVVANTEQKFYILRLKLKTHN